MTIISSNPRFAGQVVGCGVVLLAPEIVEFAQYQRNYPGKVSTRELKTGSCLTIVAHEQTSTAQTRPVAFKNLHYPQLIEIDGRRLQGGLERVPWPLSDEVVQCLTVQYLEYADYWSEFMTTLQLFLPLTGTIPQRCPWIWSVWVERFCEDVYKHCSLPQGEYCAAYKCADRNGIYTVDPTIQCPLTDPKVIAMKASFLSRLTELAKVQDGDNIRSQEFGER